MVEPSIYTKLCMYADLNELDVVLDAGAGLGFLTVYLAGKCRAVVAVEKDPHVAEVLREQVKNLVSVTVVEGDVMKAALPAFNKVIAIPPYYLSSQLVLWLFERPIVCAVMILQLEFANRLVAAVGSEDYGWLTVAAYHHAEAKVLDIVPKDLFYPQPQVDSAIVSLKPWEKRPFELKDEGFFLHLVKWLFSQRNKKVSKALAPFIRAELKLNKQQAERLAASMPFRNSRPRELRPENFGEIANALNR